MTPSDDAAAVAPRHVLALFDDAAVGAALLEWSSALARVLQRELAVVYVESQPALVAAALPFTRVLAHAGARWEPLAPEDVERGFRLQANRLRELTAQISKRHAVRWSMQVRRGALAQMANELLPESDLLLLGGTAPAEALVSTTAPPRRRQVIAALADESAAAAHGVQLAAQLAQALGAVRRIERVDAASLAAVLAGAQADLLVVPSGLFDLRALSCVRRPLLLVG
jgi:hypothetical protein